MTGRPIAATGRGAMPRAFERDGLVGRVAPFATAAAVAVVLAFIELATADRAWLLAGILLTAVVIGSTLVVPWDRLPPWMDALPPIAYVVAVAALRQATGGIASGYSPLFLVPVLWLALFGSRAQLLAVVAAMGLALLLPIVLVGEPLYPVAEWRRFVILVTIGTTLGLIVQGLVQQARERTAEAEQRSRELAEQRHVTDAIVTAASDAVVSMRPDGVITRANREAAAMFGRDDLVGQNAFAILVPEAERTRLVEGLQRVVQSGSPTEREARFETELLRADGSLIPVEIATARTEGPSGVAIHAFVLDVSRRRADEAARRGHLEDLERLLAVARSLDDTRTDARAAICDAARDLSGADFVLFFRLDPRGLRLIIAGASEGPHIPTDMSLDPTTSIAGEVLRTGTAAFVADLATDRRIDPAALATVRAGSAYWLPVVAEGRALGVLVAYWHEPIDAVPDRTIALLGLFAAQAATAIERSDLLGRLEALARTDALTGAANRRALDQALEVALADARRSGRPLSLVMLDLDHFKRFNDQHGHQAGDELLRNAAEAWRAELRIGDTLARYGGEEFVVVLVACDAATAMLVADRLRATVPGAETASAGAATWDGREPAESLLARADAALYEAKREGRDRTVAARVP